ncbi:hypothetical protein SAMN05421509_10738 [Chromohalobacter canadensis]|uniref:Uncharacterized protein n=1 Tax=Chromohalobacter canadensis TaxID=141389 RepID=A0A285VR63_9GAMM|nr:hypothetical protein [Chromohalobacter canadensis]SOC56433.1 hypothetical protein SAMN05421509_10738 [Chromohalobacter canadensis]
MNSTAKNVTAIAPHQDAHNLAAARLFRDRWENRANALANCIDHLVVDHDMTEEKAELVAIQAYADLESTNQVARIDTDASTSHMVVLRTEGGRPVMFTVTDLMHILEQARQDDRAVVVDRDRRRPVVLEH